MLDNMSLYSKEEVIQIAKSMNVPDDIINAISASQVEKYGELAYPIYLSKKHENKMEASSIMYYPSNKLFLREWRRFTVEEGRVLTDQVHRKIFQRDELDEILGEGYRWELDPKPAIFFDLDRALQGDFTGFERVNSNTPL